YTCPTIINSFLESYDFSGKTIIPFATSDGSRLGKSIQSIKDSVSDTAIVKEGKMVTGTQAYGIQGWIKDFIL
ncbi:MAG: flavodoxin, partial [Ruminiclostridium sp.]|nr:flavodoxin [Ruminiclostridium sp.]